MRGLKRRLVAPGIVAWVAWLGCVACGGSPRPIDVRQRVEVADLPPVDVQVRLQPEHRRDADRYLRAAVETIRTCEEWLGPFPHQSLTVVDPAWRARVAAAGAVVVERTPWWTTLTAMTPELATARGVSRHVWSSLIDTGALPPPLVEALVEYTARRVVTPLFQQDNLSPGYAFDEERYLGGFVPRFVRVRRLPETDRASRTFLGLATLERWLGRPVFDEVVAEFARSSRGRRPTLGDLERTASSVSGQNLSWLFDQAFRSPAALDYGIERMGDRQADGSHVTTVVVRRYGEGMFTGTSTPRIGSFESGRGIALRITFDDGQSIIDRWDGRDREKTFVYRSAAAAVFAEVDPDRTVLLDVHRTNNSRTLTMHAAGTATRWAARWMIWMQDLLLSYASLA